MQPLLTESKYNVRLALTRCWWQPRLWLSASACAIAVLLSEHPEWTLLVCLVAMGLYWCLPPADTKRRRSTVEQVTVSESGRWVPLVAERNDSQDAWQIESRSKLLPFALYLVMVSERTGRRKSLWIFPRHTSELSYRRLARIVFRQGIL
ncbi:protein YgfX [Alteromonas gilva]|uniref:Toxin CptA n=1 Tax=Alteromonas gilva TaxID=2987522 RepID=A0ABT5L8H1_9ALTE|nr:protein YgfX [Alteromonas gilva]MDC8832746.1 hypothetical protein [Alteromonas gilva]